MTNLSNAALKEPDQGASVYVAPFEHLRMTDVESVGGLLMEKLGDIPKQGQRIEFPKFDVVVKKTNGPRILLVKVIPRLERGEDEDDHS